MSFLENKNRYSSKLSDYKGKLTGTRDEPGPTGPSYLNVKYLHFSSELSDNRKIYTVSNNNIGYDVSPSSIISNGTEFTSTLYNYISSLNGVVIQTPSNSSFLLCVDVDDVDIANISKIELDSYINVRDTLLSNTLIEQDVSFTIWNNVEGNWDLLSESGLNGYNSFIRKVETDFIINSQDYFVDNKFYILITPMELTNITVSIDYFELEIYYTSNTQNSSNPNESVVITGELGEDLDKDTVVLLTNGLVQRAKNGFLKCIHNSGVLNNDMINPVGEITDENGNKYLPYIYNVSSVDIENNTIYNQGDSSSYLMKLDNNMKIKYIKNLTNNQNTSVPIVYIHHDECCLIFEYESDTYLDTILLEGPENGRSVGLALMDITGDFTVAKKIEGGNIYGTYIDCFDTFCYAGGLIDSNSYDTTFPNGTIIPNSYEIFETDGLYKLWVAKFDNTLDEQWVRIIHSNQDISKPACISDSSGNIYAFYSVNVFDPMVDVAVILPDEITITPIGTRDFIAVSKFDTNGNHQWTLKYGDVTTTLFGQAFNYTGSILLSTDETKLYIMGRIGELEAELTLGSHVLVANSYADMYIARIDIATQVVEYADIYHSASLDRPYGIIDANDNITIHTVISENITHDTTTVNLIGYQDLLITNIDDECTLLDMFNIGGENNSVAGSIISKYGNELFISAMFDAEVTTGLGEHETVINVPNNNNINQFIYLKTNRSDFTGILKESGTQGQTKQITVMGEHLLDNPLTLDADYYNNAGVLSTDDTHTFVGSTITEDVILVNINN